MAEITNTPWGERYAKCFRWKESDSTEKSEYDFRKEFHVSPFIGMDVDYDWRFRSPQETVKIDMYLRQNNEGFFSAHLRLKQKTISFINLSLALIRFPFMTVKVTAAIYWNALLLKLKGCPFYSHPKHLKKPMTEEAQEQVSDFSKSDPAKAGFFERCFAANSGFASGFTSHEDSFNTNEFWW